MKNTLFYYYKLAPSRIIKSNDYYYFEIDNYVYYLYLVNRPIEYINELLIINRSLINSNFMVIIYNLNKNAISLIDNRYYMLFRGLKGKVFDVNEFYHPFYYYGPIDSLKLLNHSDWGKLFCSKVDYFEYQKQYIKVKYKLLYKTLDYYIGLSENAISYFYAVNSYLKKDYNDLLVVSRKRINLNDFSFYNPLNIVIDNYTYDFIDSFLTNLNYSSYQYGLLISRLLFPSFYFDLYEKIVNDVVNEKEIIPILNRAKEYEEFLKYIYDFINKKESILKIDWLEVN